MSTTTVRRVARSSCLFFAFFASLAGLPLACGGTSTQNGDDSGGSNSVAGQHATAGTASMAGGAGEAGTGQVSGGTGHGPRNIACTSPKHDPVTGLVTCEEGYSHRPVAVACGSSGGGGAGNEDGPGVEGGAGGASGSLPRLPPDVGGMLVSCADDPTVCDAFEYGYCRQYRLGRACYSGCVTDDDCGAGAICLCDDSASPTGGRCHPSGCGTDQDCQPGYTCASHRGACDEGVPYACQKPEDTCEVDADCKDAAGDPGGVGQACRLQSDGHRACEPRSFCN